MIDSEPKKRPDVAREKQRNAKEESKLLRQVGERLCPEGFAFKGSFAVHVYENHFALNVTLKSQTVGLDSVPERVAEHAARELIRTVMEAYGRKAPARLDDTKPTEELT